MKKFNIKTKQLKKTFLQLTKILFLFVFSFVIVNCGNQKNNPFMDYFLLNNILTNNNNTNNNNTNKKSNSPKLNLGNMNLIDATSIYTTNEGKLYKITKQNKSVEVELKDKNGNIITIKLPEIRRILKLDKSYIIVNFKSSPDFWHLNINFNYMNYIVNTTNGNIYEYADKSESGTPNLNEDLFDIQNDKFGNIYFLVNVNGPEPTRVHQTLTSLNVENDPNILVKVLPPLNHKVSFFGMDKNGNIFYHGREEQTYATLNMYLKKDATKPIKVNIKSDNPEADRIRGVTDPASLVGDIWTGLDHEIYYCIDNGNKIYKLKSFDKSEFYGSLSEKATLCIGESNGYKMKNLAFKNNIIRIPIQYQYEKGRRISDEMKIRMILEKKLHILEVYNKKTNRPRLIDLGKYFNKNFDYYYLGTSKKYYYIQIKQKITDTNFVLRIDPEDDSATKIIDQYIVYKFVVDSDDNITFEGLRKSDMTTTVLAKIPSEQNEENAEILRENIEKGSITILKPIN